MNPAYLDYLAQMQNQQSQNPLQAGSQSAMQAAKQSLGMDEDEKRRARGLAIMQFASHLGRPGYGSGTKGLLNAIGQGVLPAYQAYQGEENRVAQLNSYLQAQAQKSAQRQAEQAYSMQMHQEKLMQRQAEQEALEKHRQAQLGEMQRYHTGQLGLMEQKAKKGETQQPLNIGGHEFTPITTTQQKNEYTKERKNMSNTLHELQTAQKQIEDYKTLLSKREGLLSTLPHPVNPYTGKMTRAITDFAGVQGWNKQLEKERIARNRLDSLLLRIRTSAERNLKGGVLAERMAQRFENKNALPSLNETMPDLEAKMKDLIDEVSARKQAADLSLHHGALITATDLERLGNHRQEEPINEETSVVHQSHNSQQPPTGIVMMQTPDGRKWSIPADKLEQAKQRGAVQIAE